MRNGTIAAESTRIIGIRKDGSAVSFGKGQSEEAAILDASALTIDMRLNRADEFSALEVHDAKGKVLAAWDGPDFHFRSDLRLVDGDA